ncbi:MAG: hypothetical protein HYT48_00560 [Candidatus Vogelbacteria bacterium]|nr:hypothetical protein [Candidatus Vogelbacteria bacterium]
MVEKKVTLETVAELVQTNSLEIKSLSRLVRSNTKEIGNLARMTAKGFAEVHDKMDKGFAEVYKKMDDEFDGVKARLTHIDNRLDTVADHGRRITRLEKKTGILA